METTSYLLRLAIEGDAEAQFRMGYRLAFGKKSPKPRKWEEVLSWWQKAASQGVRRANFYIGTCYEHGRGVPKSIEKAFDYYLEAAQDGHVEAQYNVGFCYREGQGVPQDYQRATEWLAKAARNGDEQAQRDLGYSLFYGQGIPLDKTRAVYWYRKAARAGDSKAQYNLALCYADGEGVAQSHKWEKYWLQRAASKGHIQAKKRLSTPRRRPSFFCVKMTVAIQIEGRKKGMQRYEERYVLYKGYSEAEAIQKAELAAPAHQKPYLNSDGLLVRWKVESIDSAYEVVTEANAKDFEGAEVFSVLKTRKLTPDRVWPENEKIDEV